MTPDELRREFTISLAEAAGVVGMGYTKARELARCGQWPTPLLKFGRAYRVPTAPLLELLGITGEPAREDQVDEDQDHADQVLPPAVPRIDPALPPDVPRIDQRRRGSA